MISVIVPIYKVEKYLPKCISSIINQSYADLEIILVDDGSPDACPSICDEFAAMDPRIKVVHQLNQGVSVARNVGLAIATGDFIGFCDPDDYCHELMYEKMHNVMIDYQADIVVCGYDYVDESGNVTRPYNKKDNVEILTQEKTFQYFFDMPPTMRHGVVNKLFKKDILSSLKFVDSLKRAEDVLFLSECLKYAKNIAFIHEPLYKNCERIGSATRGGLNLDTVVPALDVYQHIRCYIRQNYRNIEKHAQAYCLDAYVLAYNSYRTNIDGALLKELRRRVLKELPSALFNNEINLKTRISYFAFALGVFI